MDKGQYLGAKGFIPCVYQGDLHQQFLPITTPGLAIQSQLLHDTQTRLALPPELLIYD